MRSDTVKMRKALLLLGIVVLLVAACAPLTPSPQPVTTQPGTVAPPSPDDLSPFGINNGLGLRFDGAERDRAVQLLVDAGVKWQREEFIWSALQPQKGGQFNWDPMDAAVPKQFNAGIRMLGLLDYGAAWWGGADDKYVPSPVTSAMLDEWRDYVRQVVRRYGAMIDYWEIWNEENIDNFWKPVPNEWDYAQLLQAAYELIKQENPGDQVLIGGTSGVDLDWIDRVIAASGNVQYFDIVNVHPYIWDKNDPRSSPERRGLRSYIAPSSRYGKPVWLTEIGWSTPPDGQITETLQARYLIRSCLIAIATQGVEKVFWYNLRNAETGDANEDNYGLIRRDFSQKEAYFAYQAMARSLRGARFDRIVREAQYTNGQPAGDDVNEYHFSRGNEVVIALWKSEGGDATRPVTVQDVAANSVQLTYPGAGMAVPWLDVDLPVSGGQVTVDLNETPVFLTYTSSQGPLPTAPQPTLALPTPTLPLPSGTAETATVLLLDISGSMGRTWQGGYKIESAKEAALSVVDMIEQESQASGVRHEVAVATFSSGAWLDLPLATDYARVRQVIQSLSPNSGTNMGAGLQQANQALGSVTGAKKIIILLSDGLSNEGMSRDQILTGPVQDAAQAGTCIYTVGFGDAQDLDENLLRQIAQAACGQYAYASTPYDLLKVYVEIRHRSSGGTILDRFGGQIRQDETTPVREVQVEANQSQMLGTVAYGGSRLDLILTDPRGRRVDANYPGATLATYARMAYTIITDPLPGIWQVAIYGASVPEGILDYETILSTRPSAAPAVPSNTGLLLLVVFAAVLMGGGFLGAILYSQSRAGRRPPGVPMAADAGVAFAHDPGRWAAFRGGALHIGREPAFELTLTDPRVSRSHARILQTPQGHVIEDTNSTNGTYVNGHRINRQALRSGDGIQVGDTQLVFWEGGRRPR